MHYTRILALVGGIVAAIALFLKSASSDAGDVLAQLSQANEAFPSGFDNIWTAIYDDKSWAAILLAIALIAAIGLVFAPPVRDALAGVTGIAVVAVGVVASIISVIAMMDATDKVDNLNAGFQQVFDGELVPTLFNSSLGFGWYLLVGGSLLIAIAGVVGVMMGRSR